ncbi:MAG: hypothetical protein P8K94_10570, partial [Amylibacter sp.]|nr:hypothetical protein [Amylibacter sp.]
SFDTTRDSNPGCNCTWVVPADTTWAAFEVWELAVTVAEFVVVCKVLVEVQVATVVKWAYCWACK